MKPIFSLSVVIGVCCQAFAFDVSAASAFGRQQQDDTDVGWVYQIAYESGGDPVSSRYFADDDYEKVPVGRGVSLGMGLYQRINSWDAYLMGSAKYASTKWTSTDSGLYRLSGALGADYFVTGNWFIGGAGYYEFKSRFYGDDDEVEVHFKNALGKRVQVGWSWISLRYNWIKYKDEYDQHYNGDNWGIALTSSFGGS